MKHVVVCEGTPERFRVFCDIERTYVLDNADESEVIDYFLDITATRARAKAVELIALALRGTCVPAVH